MRNGLIIFALSLCVSGCLRGSDIEFPEPKIEDFYKNYPEKEGYLP